MAAVTQSSPLPANAALYRESPVLPCPHRNAAGKWRALVIFMDAHACPSAKPVFLNGRPRRVSLDFYNAMKADPRLKPFR